MKHSEFSIGTEFETNTGQSWRCTDVGERSIVAIEVKPDLEESWFRGPPYVVPEVVFDEQDIRGAFRDQEEATREALAELDQGLHPDYSQAVFEELMSEKHLEGSYHYPHPRLLRIDRINITGEILQPYAVESTHEGWRILLYSPFTEAFSALPETDFVRLRPARPEDFELCRQAHVR